MVVYKLAIYSNGGTCMFETDWLSKEAENSPNADSNKLSSEEAQKLTYGLLVALRNMCAKLQVLQPSSASYNEFFSYSTNKYRLHTLITASVFFACWTEPTCPALKDLLTSVHRLYVDYVVKNPLCPLGRPITSQLFARLLDDLITRSSAFASRTAASPNNSVAFRIE